MASSTGNRFCWHIYTLSLFSLLSLVSLTLASPNEGLELTSLSSKNLGKDIPIIKGPPISVGTESSTDVHLVKKADTHFTLIQLSFIYPLDPKSRCNTHNGEGLYSTRYVSKNTLNQCQNIPTEFIFTKSLAPFIRIMDFSDAYQGVTHTPMPDKLLVRWFEDKKCETARVGKTWNPNDKAISNPSLGNTGHNGTCLETASMGLEGVEGFLVIPA